MTGRNSRARRIVVFRAAAVLGGLLVACALLEIAVRLVEAWRVTERAQTEPWAIYDPDLGYRLNPGVGEINHLGTLGPAPRLGTDGFRILMLGDSVGFDGASAADTYVGRLEATLRTVAPDARIEIVNASVPGYTNYQELVFLRKFGAQFEPDLVGVGFVLNDLHRYLHAFRVENEQIVGTGYAPRAEVEELIGNPLVRLARRSHALRWLGSRFAIVGRLAELVTVGGYTFEYRPDFAPAWQEAAWRSVADQLRAMVALGDERDFEVFLVAFPYGEQLREDYLARDRDYVLLPQRRLTEICERVGIPMLDLVDVLEPARHLEEDGVHLTAAGRQIAAVATAEFLSDSRLLPAASR